MSFMLSLIFCFFLGIFLNCAYLILVDLVLSSIYFLVNAQWISLVSFGVDSFSRITGLVFFTESNWRISTGLLGFDYLVNSFIRLQYGYWGRLAMVIISGAICATIFLGAVRFTNWEPGEGLSWEEKITYYSGIISSTFLLLPVSMIGALAAFLEVVMVLFR